MVHLRHIKVSETGFIHACFKVIHKCFWQKICKGQIHSIQMQDWFPFRPHNVTSVPCKEMRKGTAFSSHFWLQATVLLRVKLSLTYTPRLFLRYTLNHSMTTARPLGPFIIPHTVLSLLYEGYTWGLMSWEVISGRSNESLDTVFYLFFINPLVERDLILGA